MALGTPVAGTIAYSAQNGSSVAPPYPSGITSTHQLVLLIGMKPSTANSGSVTSPSGWTLRESLTAAGGYSTTLGVDTGNTNLYAFTKDTVSGSETGTLTVTVGTNNVCWAVIIRVPTGGGAISYGASDGSRTTTPTSPMVISMTDGASPVAVQSGDLILWGMCIPTDVGAAAQFSSIFVQYDGNPVSGTSLELGEPSSAVGNDIGGVFGYSTCDTTPPAYTALQFRTALTGTLTNVRGPAVLFRLREGPAPQTLSPSRLDNSSSFYAATVSTGAVSLSAGLLSNSQAFYAATVSQPGADQSLTQSSTLAGGQSFFAPTVVAGAVTLLAGRIDNSQTFYAPAVSVGARTLTASLLTNLQTFYGPSVSVGSVTLSPPLHTSGQTFYGATIAQGGASQTLTPARLDNANSFFAAAVSVGAVALTPARVDGFNAFFAATLSQAGGAQTLTPGLYTNSNAVYAAAISTGAVTLAPGWAANSNTFYGHLMSGDGLVAVSDYATLRRRRRM